MPMHGEGERRINVVDILRFARGGTVVAVRLPRSRYVANRRDTTCPLFRYIIVRATGTIKQSFRTEIQQVQLFPMKLYASYILIGQSDAVP